MKLILGGAYQGKTDFVRANFGVPAARCTAEEALKAAAVNCFHLLVRDLMAAGRDPQQFTEKLIRENPGAIIICDEVGMGIVPMDKTAANLREAVGRCLCLIARESDHVSRIVAGMEMRIK